MPVNQSGKQADRAAGRKIDGWADGAGRSDYHVYTETERRDQAHINT